MNLELTAKKIKIKMMIKSKIKSENSGISFWRSALPRQLIDGSDRTAANNATAVTAL